MLTKVAMCQLTVLDSGLPSSASHRHPQDHDCTKMPEREKSVPMAETAKMVKEIQGKSLL